MARLNWTALNTLILLAFLSVPITVAAAGTPAAGISAHETIQLATDHLLRKLSEVKHLYAKEPQRFYYEVESALAPYIDFDRFSRGVMAKYYRKATPAQKEKFKVVFKDGLIRTYAKALIEFDNEKIIVLPPAKKKPPQRKTTTVKMEVYSKNGNVYPVDYTAVLTSDGWKVKNVRIEGINLGLQFRDKFKFAMGSKKGDIDQVIDSWNSPVVKEK